MKYIIKNIIEAKRTANEILSRSNMCCNIKRPYKRPIFVSNDLNLGLATGIYKIVNNPSEADLIYGTLDENGIRYIHWRSFNLKSNRSIFIREGADELRSLFESVA